MELLPSPSPHRPRVIYGASAPRPPQRPTAHEGKGATECDILLNSLLQEERRAAAYEEEVDAFLSVLLGQREVRERQEEVQVELLCDFRQQQTQLTSATGNVRERLRRVEARTAAMAAVVRELETEKQHLEEAKGIVNGILQLRTLKDQLAAALTQANLLDATEAACRAQQIRAFFASVDARYATPTASRALPRAPSSPGQAAPVPAPQSADTEGLGALGPAPPPPRLCTVEAAVLHQLQELQAQLTEGLSRRVAAACVSATREQRAARRRAVAGGADRDAEGEGACKLDRGRAETEGGIERGGGDADAGGQLSGAGPRGEWKKDLAAAFALLRALQLHQDALQRFVELLRAQLADTAARRFKVLLQLQKQHSTRHCAGDALAASNGSQDHLHSAAFAQLSSEVAEMIVHHVKALEAAAAAAPPCGSCGANVSMSGEAAAAGLFAIVALRQETDIQSVRILNHFSDCNEDVLAMKVGEKQTTTSLRRVDCVLSEIVALSACCMRLHRRFRVAAARRGSSLLLQPQLDGPQEGKDGDAAAQETQKKTGKSSTWTPTLVEFVRQCSACGDLAFQGSPLMKGREELMAHYVSLENAFIIGSVDQALNVADEIPLLPAGARAEEVEVGGDGFAPWGAFGGEKEEEEDDERLYSTVIDDVFFILTKSVLRAINSLDVLAVCAVVNNVCAVLSSDVKAKLRRNLEESKAYYANYIKHEPHALRYSLGESLREIFGRREGQPPESLKVRGVTPESREASGAQASAAGLRGRGADGGAADGRACVFWVGWRDTHQVASEACAVAFAGSSYSWPHSVNNVALAVETLKKFKDRVARDFAEAFARRRKAETEDAGGDEARDLQDEQSDGETTDGVSEAEEDEAPEDAPRGERGAASQQAAKAGTGAANDLMMFQYTLQAVDGVVEELQGLHERCCRVTLKFVQPHLHRGLDLLHNAVFEIHEDNSCGGTAGGDESAGLGGQTLGSRGDFMDGGEGGDERLLQERWRLQLQRGLAIILSHVGREYDRPTQNLCCSLLLQVLATKMETLLLDKTYTALGGLQLSAQLRRFLQQVSALHHASGAGASVLGGQGVGRAPLASRRNLLDFSSAAVFRNGSSALDAGASLFGALAAAAAGAGDNAVDEAEQGEGALARVRIFCDSPIRPKFGRLLEISELLGLGSLDELLDIWGPSSGKFWRLSVDEIKKVLARRVDLTKDDIEAFFETHQGK
ncbi:hypothetical protein BESB_055060 [Besnoitia besnoiti]|uniref:COG4 transport protein middle alpha-helical bundle domain-containing protein n=1 Tax=Besnoitia besnoiti TaxID=94643 RepID=A0A2A9MCY7_BESBE|nr:hypothetical protein BESB_055060 [Besnoitia besnoiti]PFH35855.1 hypothetical protein BESB_055060 [Besnoitia besnoiti]